MEIRVLGSIEVWNGDLVAIGGPRQRRILGALAMDAGSVVSLDRLVDVTWSGEDPPAQADRNVTLAEWDQFGPQGEDYRATCQQYPPGT